MRKHEYQRRILSILRGDEDFLVKLFKSLTDDKIPLIENKESLRAFLIELYLADAKSKNIEIIDDDFAIEVKRYSQKHSSLMVLIKNGIKISLDEIVEQMYWWLKDFVYSEFKDLILYLLQIQPLEVRLESMQSIIYKAIDNKDFDFVKQLINLSDQNNLKIIDESFVKNFRLYDCPYSLILILVKKGMKFSLDQLRRASELKDNEYDDYKNLVLLMVQDEIMQTNQESLSLIFEKALRKDDVEFAEKLFDNVNSG